MDVAARELVERCARQAGHFRRDTGGFNGGLSAGLQFFNASHHGLAGGGKFVDAIGTVHDKGALRSESGERAAHEKHAAGGEHADHLERARAGLVSGPQRLKMVRKPRARRSGATVFMAGW